MPYKNKDDRNKHYREKYAKTNRVKGINTSKGKRYLDSEKNSQLERTYGISLQEFNLMFLEQQGKCKICGKHQKEMKRAICVDHDHITGKVRGLLCNNCNAALGNFHDSIEIIEKALDYLKGGLL